MNYINSIESPQRSSQYESAEPPSKKESGAEVSIIQNRDSLQMTKQPATNSINSSSVESAIEERNIKESKIPNLTKGFDNKNKVASQVGPRIEKQQRALLSPNG